MRANRIIAVVAFVFTFYVLSFFFDLRPNARTKEEVREDLLHEQMQRNKEMQQPSTVAGANV